METIEFSQSDDSPYCVMTHGHLADFTEFLAEANDGWSDTAFQPETTRHEYALPLPNGKWKLNVSADTPKAIAVTVTYWEEPMPALGKGGSWD